MTRSNRLWRGLGKLHKSGAVGIAGVVLLFGPAWAGPPNPTPSDAAADTAGGTGAVANTLFGANTGFGFEALISNTTGQENAAFGAYALYYNGANNNTATGFIALLSNTTGQNNTASGSEALASNSTASNNAAFGYQALFNNNGENNTGSGTSALYSNNTGDANTASGVNALYKNTTGAGNTASGVDALYANNTGGLNTGIGEGAGLSNTIGIGNTFVGAGADTNAGIYTNGTALGYTAELTASNSIVLGNSSISRIYANVTTITAISDRRRKKDIRALDTDLGLDFIEKLQPVSYRFNNDDETERYGFVAQDLEQALPAALHDTIERSEPEHGLALIERQNDKDRTYRVSYGELTAPIVKAIQQQQQEIEAERQRNAELRRSLEGQIAALKAQIEGQRDQVTAAR